MVNERWGRGSWRPSVAASGEVGDRPQRGDYSVYMNKIIVILFALFVSAVWFLMYLHKPKNVLHKQESREAAEYTDNGITPYFDELNGDDVSMNEDSLPTLESVGKLMPDVAKHLNSGSAPMVSDLFGIGGFHEVKRVLRYRLASGSGRVEYIARLDFEETYIDEAIDYKDAKLLIDKILFTLNLPREINRLDKQDHFDLTEPGDIDGTNWVALYREKKLGGDGYRGYKLEISARSGRLERLQIHYE